MLVLIIGENGSGKTFFMVICALSVLSKNIYANFRIEHPNYHYLEIDDFLKIPPNTDVFIDEAYTWLESRRSSKYTNVYISEIKEQKRKTDSTWYITEQRERMIDKRFENYWNVLIECKPRFPIGHSTEDFHYKITFDYPREVVYKSYPYIDAIKYFNYFNTNEKVEPENRQKLEYEMIKSKPKKLIKKVNELAKIIEKNNPMDNYTHPFLKWACLENHIITDYEPWLYLYFKKKTEIKKTKGSV